MTREQFIKAVEAEQAYIMRNSKLKSGKAWEIAVQNVLQEIGHKNSTYWTINSELISATQY